MRWLLILTLLGTTAEAKRRHHRHQPRPQAEESLGKWDDARPAQATPVVEPPAVVEISPVTAPDNAVEVRAPRPLLPRAQALEIAVGAGVVTRELSFNDDLFSRLHGYRIDAAPTVDAQLAWFPGAHFTRGAGAHVGLRVHGSWVAVAQSRTTDGATYSTTAYSTGVEVLGRIPTRRAQPELAVGYGRQAFEIHGQKPAIPSATYDFLRFALGLRVWVWRLELSAHGAYRWVAGAGELASSSWFPRASLHAVDVDAGVALRLGKGVSLRARLDFSRMFASLHPQPGDPFIAGGAVDQTLGGSLQLAYAY